MVTSTRDESRRKQARRSTLAGVGGILAMAVGFVLTLANIGGYVFPTVLAIAGAGSLLAGVATGTTLIADNFRVRRDQSYYDED